jgi:transposase-like protein
MSNYQSRRAFGTAVVSKPATTTPVACPTCESASIQTSKTPSSDSYWRCARCGEIWNATRHDPRVLRPRR